MNRYKLGDHLVAEPQFETNELFRVERIGRNGEIYDEEWRLLYGDNFNYATEKEIAQGYRDE